MTTTQEDRKWRAAGKTIPAKAGAKEASRWLAGLLVAKRVEFYSWDKANEQFIVARTPEENIGLGTDGWQGVPMSPDEVARYCYGQDPTVGHALTETNRAALVAKFKLGQQVKERKPTAAEYRHVLEHFFDQLPAHVQVEARRLGIRKEGSNG